MGQGLEIHKLRGGIVETGEPKDVGQENGAGGEKEIPNGGRPYLLIQVTEDSGLSVVGCIGDMVRSFGLLEAAKLEIADFHKRANQPKIVKGGMLDFVRGRK